VGKKNYWVKYPKAAREFLPHNRPYTKSEAVISMLLDNDEYKTVTVSGYSKLWRWSRRRVKNFLKYMGIHIIYPVNTVIKQNQRGYLSGGQIPTQITPQIKLIENNELTPLADRCRHRYRPTTIKNKNKKEIYSAVVSHLNEKLGTKYRVSTKATQALINARVSEGYTVKDFKEVIDYKCADWKGSDYGKYLTPATLFSAKHFEPYLQNALTQPQTISQPRN